MSLVIRFANAGKRGERKYHLVVAERRSRRNGRPVDTLGYFEKRVGAVVVNTIDTNKVKDWQKKGAQLSTGARKILESK